MILKVKTLGAAILTAIFWLQGSVVCGSPIDSDHQNHQTFEQEQNLALLSGSLFYLNAQAENSVNSLNEIPVPKIRRSQGQHRSETNLMERLLDAEFGQYCNFSLDFLIQLRPPDIIFPFHYFW